MPAKYPVTQSGNLYTPLTAAEIKAKGISLGVKCSTLPAGWTDPDVDTVLLEGFSRAGIHNLNPSPSHYNAAGLLLIKDKMTPHLLDPSLEDYQTMYALGNGKAMGFYPNDALIAKRQKVLEEQSAKQKGKGGTKRPYRDSSTSSTASNPNERESQQSSYQTGGKLSYSNNPRNLLAHENECIKIRKVLNNRLDRFGRSVTGTVIKNDPVNPVTFQLFGRGEQHSESKRIRLVNLKGDQTRSMVYCKLLEDSGLKPNEFSVYCDQCDDHHPAHNGEPMKIVFISENRELINGARSHSGAHKDPSFRELLKSKGICPSQMVHIEFVDVRDGGVFADNLTWLTALIERESMCRCFIFWNVGTSFLLSGGSVAELLAKNLIIEDHVTKMECKIRHTVVDVGHKFIYVPLVYTRETSDLEFHGLEREEQDTGNLPVFGTSFNNLMVYNSRVRDLVKQNYPTSEGRLGDPNVLLAVEYLPSSTKVYGVTYNTSRYTFRNGNHPHNHKLMHDGARQEYLVSLIRWVKDTFEQETKDEMALKKVPQLSVSLKLVKRYTRHSQIF